MAKRKKSGRKPAKSKKQSAPDFLEAAANTYRQRNKMYGTNYRHFGKVMSGLFPQGLELKTDEQWVRLGLVQNCVTKLGRYCAKLESGHKDSARDLSVYAAMLEEMT